MPRMNYIKYKMLNFYITKRLQIYGWVYLPLKIAFMTLCLIFWFPILFSWVKVIPVPPEITTKRIFFLIVEGSQILLLFVFLIRKKVVKIYIFAIFQLMSSFMIIYSIYAFIGLYLWNIAINGLTSPMHLHNAILIFPLLSFIIYYIIYYRLYSNPTIQQKFMDKKQDIELKKSMALNVATKDIQKAKNQLFGFIKVEKKISLPDTSQILRMSRQNIRSLIYEMVGEGKLEGEFSGDTFVITSSVNDLLLSLDATFEEWNLHEQTKHGKLQN